MNASELAHAANLIYFVSWEGKFPKGTSFEFIQKMSINGLINYEFLFGKDCVENQYNLKVTDKGNRVMQEWRR